MELVVIETVAAIGEFGLKRQAVVPIVSAGDADSAANIVEMETTDIQGFAVRVARQIGVFQVSRTAMQIDIEAIRPCRGHAIAHRVAQDEGAHYSGNRLGHRPSPVTGGRTEQSRRASIVGR